LFLLAEFSKWLRNSIPLFDKCAFETEKHGGDEVATLRDNMEKFKLDLEHQLTCELNLVNFRLMLTFTFLVRCIWVAIEAVNDGLKHSFKKLQKQEDDMEKRLEILEQKFKDMVCVHLF
jgi:hypothetical protein